MNNVEQFVSGENINGEIRHVRTSTLTNKNYHLQSFSRVRSAISLEEMSNTRHRANVSHVLTDTGHNGSLRAYIKSVQNFRVTKRLKNYKTNIHKIENKSTVLTSLSSGVHA